MSPLVEKEVARINENRAAVAQSQVRTALDGIIAEQAKIKLANEVIISLRQRIKDATFTEVTAAELMGAG